MLNEVVNLMQETDRSFIPYAVSPPPPGAAGQLSAEAEFLTVFPHFVPINKNTVWRGDLLAFEFNKNQAVLPTTAECTVDTSQVVWEDSSGNPAGAAAILAEQMADYSSGNRTRHIYFGSDYSGSWQRYKMEGTVTVDLPSGDVELGPFDLDAQPDVMITGRSRQTGRCGASLLQVAHPA